MIAATAKPKSVWQKHRFSDFVHIAPKVTLQQGSDYSFVEMAELHDGNKFCNTSVLRPFNGSGTKFQDSDTLFARITPCLENGKICQVRNLSEGKGFGSTEFHIFRGKEGVSDTEFVYYLSRWSDVREFAEANLHGTSGRQRVPKEAFDTLLLNLPPLPEQRAIAAVLSSLDDKIDLLHRQNKTLEGMASALWRKMFIEEADPKWKKRSLLELIDLVGGGTPKTDVSEYWDDEIPWLSAKDITANHQGFIVQTEKSISQKGLDNSAAKLLPKYSTIISARGTVGNYCLLSAPMAFSQSNYGILPKTDDCFFFTYLLIAHVVDELKAAAYGSVFDTITTKTFLEQEVSLPAKDTIISVEKILGPYFYSIYNNTMQNRTLSRLRDTLLPKLMSGEIRV